MSWCFLNPLRISQTVAINDLLVQYSRLQAWHPCLSLSAVLSVSWFCEQENKWQPTPTKKSKLWKAMAEVEKRFSQMSEFLSASLVSVLIKFPVKLFASYGTFASWLTEVLFSLWERGCRRMDLDLSSLCLRELEGWNNTPHFSLGNESYYLKNYNTVRKKFC